MTYPIQVVHLHVIVMQAPESQRQQAFLNDVCDISESLTQLSRAGSQGNHEHGYVRTQNSIPDAENDPEGSGGYARAIAAEEFKVCEIDLHLLLHILAQTRTISMSGIMSTPDCWLVFSLLSSNIHS
jgi:hypothetical protein